MRKHRDKDILEGHFGHFNDKGILVNISAHVKVESNTNLSAKADVELESGSRR